MIVHRRLIASVLRPAARVLDRVNPGHRVLMYHRVRALSERDQLSVSPQRFAEQLECLSARRVVGLDTVLRELQTGIMDPAVALTFDDGYADNLTSALPLLERHNIPATIFVVTEFCDGAHRHPRYRSEPDVHLNWEQVRHLAAHPLIEIGSHTVTHPLLANLDDEAARREIVDSRRQLEDRLDRPVRFFCYPSGNFSVRDTRLVAAAGYQGAVTVHPGRNGRGISPFLVNRTEVTDDDRSDDLRAKLDGAYDLPHTILHWRRLWQFRRLRRRRGPAANSD